MDTNFFMDFFMENSRIIYTNWVGLMDSLIENEPYFFICLMINKTC
jgi:hypothetical protein